MLPFLPGKLFRLPSWPLLLPVEWLDKLDRLKVVDFPADRRHILTEIVAAHKGSERMSKPALTAKPDAIESKIYSIRGQRVMLDFDLARLYEVETRVLKQSVRRNLNRFPEDFMFQLSKEEWKEVVTNCDKLQNTVKYSPSLPFAFTEHGVLMLASVLHSERAIEVNIQITRTFIKLRQLASANAELAAKVKELEKTVRGNTGDIKLIFATINSMLKPKAKKKPQIGFKPEK